MLVVVVVGMLSGVIVVKEVEVLDIFVQEVQRQVLVIPVEEDGHLVHIVIVVMEVL